MDLRRIDRAMLLALAGLLLLLSPRGYGSEVSPSGPVVVGFDRFAGDVTDSHFATQAGRLLLGELNCVACHRPRSAAPLPITAKQAPVLTAVGERVQPEFLRRFIENPQAVKPGTTMPGLFLGLEPAERRRRVEAIVHYLASLGNPPRQQFPIVGAGARGRELFHQVGCVACHGAREDEARHGYEVPLGELNAKYTLPSLTGLLEDPLHVRPGGRMPDFRLTTDEARDIAAFLLELPEVARVRYEYFEGDWNDLPEFRELKPVTTGGADQIDVAAARRQEHFALRFEGFLHVDDAGEFTFYLGSDDGSRLLIDDRVVIGHGGIHAFSTVEAKYRLEQGVHKVVVEYFEQGGEQRLVAEWEGPGTARQPLAQRMTAEREVPSLEAASLRLDVRADLVTEGRKWFSAMQCTACHTVEENGAPVPAPTVARALEQLRPGQGCMNEVVAAGAADYQLRPAHRTALQHALEQLRHPTPDTASDSIVLTLQAFNCYACHERDDQGGVQEAHNAWFHTTVPEMGDEGRIPPRLTGVGGKLTSRWLAQLVANGAKDRPYMQTKMPRFGTENAGHLVELLAATDQLPSVEPLTFTEPLLDIKEAGRKLVGEAGLSCIKCHTFGPFRSQGIQSINMRLMTERLREEWFRPYLRNPQAFRPGTRMPAAWPPTGKSFFTEHFDGDTDKQIAAVWQYLSDGERARIPAGLVTPSMELVPVDHAIVYRNFISGVGARAIAVGYPEGVHQAFDAQNLRLALLWKGRFIDASRHWSGRGDGFQGPAGDSILSLADGPPFAVLADPQESWPEASSRALGYRFRGYQLGKDARPTFLYTAAGLAIEDHLDTTRLGPADPLPRTLRLTAPQNAGARDQGTTYFRAAAAPTIERTEDGWYLVDASWRLRIETTPASELVLRSSGGRCELLVPVQLNAGQAEIRMSFDW